MTQILSPLTPVAPWLAGATLALSAALNAQAYEYNIINLGPVPITSSISEAHGINAGGQIVGASRTISALGVTPSRAFVYQSGAHTELPTLGGNTSYAYGINASGQVVGIATTVSGAAHAFLYSAGVMIDLGTFGGTTSRALAINNAGQVVGSANTGELFSYEHAFLYDRGEMIDLGTLGGVTSAANAINNLGQIVGAARNALFQNRAFLYSDGVMYDLGTLGGDLHSYATGINDLGQIVGAASTADPFVTHAFLYSGGVMYDLGVLGSGRNSQANAINNRGEIVGRSDTFGAAASRAFIYRDGMMRNLQDLMPPNSELPPGSRWLTLREATAINDRGEIVGNGVTVDGYAHAFLLIPTQNNWSIYWRHAVSGALALWEMTGTQLTRSVALSPPQVADLNWQIRATPDINRDGSRDLVWQHMSAGFLTAWIMNGAQRIANLPLNPSPVAVPEWEIVASADFDGDGQADLVWRQRATGANRLWLMRDDGITRDQVVALPTLSDLSWTIVAAGDFNGDNEPDLLWQHQSTGELGLWLTQGGVVTSVTSPSPSFHPEPAWRIVGVVDATGDGKLDLLWRNQNTGDIQLWEMNGMQFSREITLPSLPDLNWKIVGPK